MVVTLAAVIVFGWVVVVSRQLRGVYGHSRFSPGPVLLWIAFVVSVPRLVAVSLDLTEFHGYISTSPYFVNPAYVEELTFLVVVLGMVGAAIGVRLGYSDVIALPADRVFWARAEKSKLALLIVCCLPVVWTILLGIVLFSKLGVNAVAVLGSPFVATSLRRLQSPEISALLALVPAMPYMAMCGGRLVATSSKGFAAAGYGALVCTICVLGVLGGRTALLFCMVAFLVGLLSARTFSIGRVVGIVGIAIVLAVGAIAGVTFLRHARVGAVAEGSYGRVERPFSSTPIKDSILSVVSRISYVDTYALIVVLDPITGRYGGASFAELPTAFAPRAWVKSKPPVDEGVRLVSRAVGLSADLGTDAKELFGSSWPVETVGNGFQNFGLLGVLVLSALHGYLVAKAYEFCVRQGTLFGLYFYLLMCGLFQISNVRIVQVVIAVAAVVALNILMDQLIVATSRRERRIPASGAGRR